MAEDWIALLLAQGERIERKLDQLISALAEEVDDDAVKSLDGLTFAPRDDKKGLG